MHVCFPSRALLLAACAALLIPISAAPAPVRSAGLYNDSVRDAGSIALSGKIVWYLGDQNGPPVAVDDAYTTPINVPLIIGAAQGVLANDTDPNNDPLTARAGRSGVSNGILLLNADGSFIYTPAPGFSGMDTFTYEAFDGRRDSNIATVTITVGSQAAGLPVANNDSYLTNKAFTTSAASGLLANDSSPSGGAITVSSSTQTSDGNIVVNADGSFAYTPNANFDGTDTFTYIITDGTNQSQAADVSIRVDITPPSPVTWAKPAADGAVDSLENGAVTLEVLIPTPAPDFSKVTFYRWDPVLNQRIELGSVTSSPYSVSVSADSLRFGWNQIDAAAVDQAGNASTFKHIWLIRSTGIFLPLIRH